MWQNWHPKIDYDFGGRIGAPKFMMPNNYDYLLRYFQKQKVEVGEAIKITLKKWHLAVCMMLLAVDFQDTV